jgi:hypothetical protein
MLNLPTVIHFGDALGGLEVNISLHEDPIAWLDANMRQILAATTEVLGVSIDGLADLRTLLCPVI